MDWETDLNLTADGEIVLMHDMTLDRTTNAREIFGGRDISVNSKTLAQIKTLDAGNHFSPEYKGEKVPTLDEFLDFFLLHAPENTVISMDTKLDRLSPNPEVYQRIIDKISTRDLFNRVFIEVYAVEGINRTKTLRNGEKLNYAIWVSSDTILLNNAMESGYFKRIHASNKIAFKTSDVYKSGIPVFSAQPVQTMNVWDYVRNYDINAVSTDLPDITLDLLNGEIPACIIKYPENNTFFKQGQKLTIDVVVGDTDSSIEKIEFYSDGNLIGQDTTRPYSYYWGSSDIGKHFLEAKVFDNGKNKTSLPVTIIVTYSLSIQN